MWSIEMVYKNQNKAKTLVLCRSPPNTSILLQACSQQEGEAESTTGFSFPVA
jgi:hypothetical protein